MKFILAANTRVIKGKEDNMELMKNLRASQMNICMAMSTQGLLCCHVVLWHGYSSLVQLCQVCF